MMIRVFAQNQENEAIYSNARIYARISVLNWFLIALIATYGSTIREMGFTKLPFI